MKKRLLGLILVGVMVLGLCACGEKKEYMTQESNVAQESSIQEASEPEITQEVEIKEQEAQNEENLESEGSDENSSTSSLVGKTYKKDDGTTYYTDLQYNNKQIIEGTYQSYQFDAAIPYISYSYEQNPDIITDYEEERAKYNTAPDNWQEHPYTSYLPQIPSGITVDYAEGNTINETNLALCTEDNGCTKEQAESYLEAFSNIEYENEIVELRTEVTDDYEHMLIRHLKGNIRILIFWRVEEQKLFIYVDKQ